jgi:hypothetical protein
MEFNQTYTSESEKAKEENKNKKIISDDAFALGETIQELIKAIRYLSLKIK